MAKLQNAQRAAMAKFLEMSNATLRRGEVSSYDPKTYKAKVTIMPEQTETGWLDIAVWGVGQNFGAYFGLLPGDQVLVAHVEGDAEAGIILGRTNNDVETPPAVDGGEVFIGDKAGSSIQLTKDGKLAITTVSDLNVTVGGKINATVQSDCNLNVTGKTIVTCSDVELGAAGGKKVALDGDPVVGGVIQASSTKVKAT